MSTKQPKEQRFQMWLHEQHDRVAASAAANGRTLSSEVRHRVEASFEQEAKLAELREWFNDHSWEHHAEPGSLADVDLNEIWGILDKPHTRANRLRRTLTTMLRLTRSVRGFGHAPGRDTIILADGLIKIVVERVEGNRVALAIDAPRDISVLRAELLNRASPSAQKDNHATR